MEHKQRIHLTGQLPERWREALEALAPDLGMVPAEDGVEVACSQGDHLAVMWDGGAVRVTWAKPVQLWRALSLIPQPLAPCHIQERPRFASAGAMFDCSRNGVLKPETVRFFLRKMALMGLDLAMLYTEDIYEVPERPFFGYKRGRYSFDELRALDDYGDMLGIELVPCMQTLGHMKRALHWPSMRHLRDNADVLLADQEETYTFIEEMIRAASAPFRSRRIHIGMDEAYGMGVGEHLIRFGYEDPRRIIGRHLSRVLDITDKYGLQPLMWSDMYFHLDGGSRSGGGYDSSDTPSEVAIAAVDRRVSLVYWDYYHAREEEYARNLKKHASFGVPVLFAGGLWTWAGPAPAYPMALDYSAAGLAASMKAGVDTVIATAWGDDGAETNLLVTLPGLQLYAEMTYTGVYDPAALAARFRRCCRGDMQAFLDLGRMNATPEMHSQPGDPANACKFMLYQDPLVELFEADMEPFHLAEHYASLAPLYARYAKESPEYRLLFSHYAAMAHALNLKCAWHESAAAAVRAGDRKRATTLAESVPAIREAIETLRRTWRQLWESTNKPNGFEVIDGRLGAVLARLSTAEEKMRDFAAGATDDIPELTEPSLVCKRRPDGTICFTNIMEEIATAGAIDQ